MWIRLGYVHDSFSPKGLSILIKKSKVDVGLVWCGEIRRCDG